MIREEAGEIRRLFWSWIFGYRFAFFVAEKKDSSREKEPARGARRKIDDTRPAVAICAFCARRYVRQMYSYASRIDRATQLHDAESAGSIWRRARYRGIVGARGSSASFSSRFALASLLGIFQRPLVLGSRPRSGIPPRTRSRGVDTGFRWRWQRRRVVEEERRDRGAVLRDWVRAIVARVCLLCCESILSEF